MNTSNLIKVLAVVFVLALLGVAGAIAYQRSSAPVSKEAANNAQGNNTQSGNNNSSTSGSGKEQLSNTASLTGADGQSVGDVTRELKDQKVTVAVRAKKLPDLTSGFYGVFFTDKAGTIEPPAFIGTLAKQATGSYAGEYVLGSQGPEAWMSYTNIVVTSIDGVSSGSVPKMGKAVLSGSFAK